MSFTSQATERLNQQAPELGKAVLAFKDLTDELPDDSGIQVGLFIIKIGVKYMYIPVIAKAETIQPIDSMFCAETKKFIPLTKKSVRWIIESNTSLGSASKIPDGVARDPNLYDAIVPPKTGKYTYASEGRISGFLEMLPNHIKQAMLDTICKDIEVQNSINKVMDFNDVFMGPLNRETPEYNIPTKDIPVVEVLTGGKDLTDSEVQDILNKGYAVRNSPVVGSLAIESSGANTWTKVSTMLPGTAYSSIRKDGTPVTLVSLPKVPSANVPEAEAYRDSSALIVSTDGGVYTDPNMVIMQQEQDFDAAVNELSLKSRNISLLSPTLSRDKLALICAGDKYIGPVDVITVDKAGGWVTAYVDDNSTPRVIRVHQNVRTPFNQVGNQITLGPDATFIEVDKAPKEIETDINTAEMKYDLLGSKILPVHVNIIHRDDEYAVDGKLVGGKAKMIEHMLTSWGLDIATAESFLDSAKRKSSTMIKMAAARGGIRKSPGGGSRLSEIPEVGEKPTPTVQITGDSRQRMMGMSDSINRAAEVNDREVMEATIISQILQNPDMHGSISEYLPDIKDAVDRLGRTLLLMRINTQKLAKTIESEALNNLLTSTRNSYRILGETYVELSNLVDNE